VPVRYDPTVEDFVSYGSYGPLHIWSTTKLEDERCIAVVIDKHISVFDQTMVTADYRSRTRSPTRSAPPLTSR
jgi:hypothetical protein